MRSDPEPRCRAMIAGNRRAFICRRRPAPPHRGGSGARHPGAPTAWVQSPADRPGKQPLHNGCGSGAEAARTAAPALPAASSAPSTQAGMKFIQYCSGLAVVH